MIHREKLKFAHMTLPALRHGIAFRRVTDEAIGHQGIVLAAAEIGLLQAAVTGATRLFRIYLFANSRAISLRVLARLKRTDNSLRQIRNRQMLLVAEKNRSRRDFGGEIRSFTPLVAFFGPVAQLASFGLREIRLCSSAALFGGGMASHTVEPYRFQMHRVRESQSGLLCKEETPEQGTEH